MTLIISIKKHYDATAICKKHEKAVPYEHVYLSIYLFARPCSIYILHIKSCRLSLCRQESPGFAVPIYLLLKTS